MVMLAEALIFSYPFDCFGFWLQRNRMSAAKSNDYTLLFMLKFDLVLFALRNA